MANTFEDLMNPAALQLQAKYENARLAVNIGWQLASKKYETMEELATTARWIAAEVGKDFNATLLILEEKQSGPKTEPSQILRPS